MGAFPGLNVSVIGPSMSGYTKAKVCKIWCGLWGCYFRHILVWSFPLQKMLLMNGILFFMSCASSTVFLGTPFFFFFLNNGSGCSQNVQNTIGNVLFESFETSIVFNIYLWDTMELD